jgi:hypothetical protein
MEAPDSPLIAAHKTEDGWHIDEFSFPVRDWRCVRADPGKRTGAGDARSRRSVVVD